MASGLPAHAQRLGVMLADRITFAIMPNDKDAVDGESACADTSKGQSQQVWRTPIPRRRLPKVHMRPGVARCAHLGVPAPAGCWVRTRVALRCEWRVEGVGCGSTIPRPVGR